MTALVQTLTSARDHAQRASRAGQTVGLVPTMGALHQGHGRLIEIARRECDVVVVSIFVNPLQFDRADDLSRYPRSLEADLELCRGLGVDAVFAPEAEEMYPRAQACEVRVRRLTDHLCGPFRPGHFDGMATVVLKLFEIVPAARAYFGEKDAQQLAVIRRLVDDFNVPITIVGVPTVREPDGLAMSSRNRHLNPAERIQARALYGALQAASGLIRSGIRSTPEILQRARATIPGHDGIRLEYLQIVDPDELQPVDDVTGPVLIAGAMWVGSTRLIDNVIVTDQG
jgi:pantoate--beta-alanine ligase